MSVDAPGTSVPTSDVLPAGVRRRLSRRDALLPAVLLGELVAGMMLGMAWQVASTVPVVPARPPISAVSTTNTTIVVAPSVAPTAPPPPPRTEPRNPFAIQVG